MSAATLACPGLLLRPFTEADAAPFAAAVRESADTLVPWMPWSSRDYATEQALAWFAACRSARNDASAFEYAIVSAASGELLGGAGLNDIHYPDRYCNLGYWVRQSRQRQGIASRSVRLLVDYAFEALALYRVEIVVAVGNHASEGVAVKSGALREGVARNRLHLLGQPIDAHMFALVPEA